MNLLFFCYFCCYSLTALSIVVLYKQNFQENKYSCILMASENVASQICIFSSSYALANQSILLLLNILISFLSRIIIK